MFLATLLLAQGQAPPVENTCWWGAIGIATLIAALGTVLINLLVTRAQNRRTERADSILEWSNIAHDTQARYDALQTRFDAQAQAYQKQYAELTGKVYDLHQAHVECVRHETAQSGEIRLLQASVQRLQAQLGDTLPGVYSALVVADLDGVIRTVSPAVSPLLHWMPADLVRKPVAVLVPERFRAAVQAGLERIRQTNTPPWAERVITTFAATGSGGEVPVTVVLTAWQSSKQEWFVSAEIRQRSQVPVAPPAA